VSGRVLLAEYFATDDAVIMFGVRADWDQPEVVEVPIPLTELRGYVGDQFGVLVPEGEATVGSMYEKITDLDLDRWQELVGQIVRPIADWADEDDLVWLVPHDVLHYLPLHALRIDGRLLIERNPVLYTPSASVMRYCRQKRTGRPHRAALVFGDSAGDLPFAREEARIVGDLFGSVPLLGADATVTALTQLREQASSPDIVHLACHGYFDADQPLRSGIRLATAVGGEESVLTAEAIFGLDLRCDLVVLSACESGVNSRHPGDELIGLTRALIYAGTPSVVVSLWRVEDLSTLILMDRFYRGLEALDKARALQQAELALMRMSEAEVLGYVEERERAMRAAGDAAGAARFSRLAYRSLLAAERRTPRPPDGTWIPFSHPAAWAPFVLVGDWGQNLTLE
jgi:CHAT domain-containing protein